MRQISLLGVNLKDYSVRESMRRLTLYLNNGSCNTVDFITRDVLLKAADSPELSKYLEEMDMTVCTSGDMLQAGNVMSRGREREIESNLLLKGMLRKFEKEKRRLFLVCRTSELTEKFSRSLQSLHAGLTEVGRCASEEIVGGNDTIVNEINSCLPEVVLLNLPSPDAETFIHENHMRLNTQLVIALRDECLRVTEDGRVKRGGLGNYLLGRFFQATAMKYNAQESASQEKENRELVRGYGLNLGISGEKAGEPGIPGESGTPAAEAAAGNRDSGSPEGASWEESSPALPEKAEEPVPGAEGSGEGPQAAAGQENIIPFDRNRISKKQR